MKMDLFMEELSGSEPFKGLENILVEIGENEQTEKIIKDFLNRSPNCDAILQLLSTRKCTQTELSLVFNFMGYILISIANDRTSYQSVGIHVTRWILQNQAPQLTSLLNISNCSKSIISALHCITGMVVIGNAAAHEVITHLNFSRINFKVLADKNEFVDNFSVRTWIFNLILAFLNTRDTRCIRQFLQVEGSVSSLFANLENDPSDRVIKLLNLLHEVVVLDMNISKTLKVKTFNSSSCGNLMKLYKKKSDPTCDDKNVLESVHRLLITLCTDQKHGVIFKEKCNSLNGSFKSSNIHVLLILKAGKDIWGTKEGKELVAKALFICPDITKLFMEPFHSLKIEANDYFFSLIELFSEVTKNIEPWNHIYELHSKMKGSLKNTIFFIPYVTNKLLIELVGSTSDLLIHCGFILIHTVYSKIEDTLSKIKEMKELTNYEKDDYRKAVLKIAARIGGGCNKICSSWNKLISIGAGKDGKLYPSYMKDHPTQFKLLALIVNVYHQFGKLFGYNLIKQRINPINMLESVIKISKADINSDYGNYQRLLIQIFNFLIFAQNSNDFELFGYQKDVTMQNDLIILNNQWFNLLLSIYNITANEGKKEKSLEIQELCMKLLNDSVDRWGLSTHCPVDIQIWLHKLSEFNKPNINCFLVDVIVNTFINLETYIETLLALRTELEERDYDKGIDLLTAVNNACAPSSAIDNEDVQCKLGIPFSCLVVGATEILKPSSDKEILDYFTCVMGDYISILNHPKILAKYLVGNKVISSQAELYFNALLGSSSVNVVMKDDDSLHNKLKCIFMSKKYPKGSDFFNSFEKIVLSEGDLLSLSSQLLLYLKMLNNNNLDNKKKIKFYWKVLRSLLSNSATKNYISLYRYLLEHQFINDSYNPFLSSDFVYMEIKNILLTVMSTYPELHCLIRPFIKKLIFNLHNFPKECEDTTDFISCIDSFTSHYKVLNSEDLHDMITSCLCLEHNNEAMKLLSHLLQLLLKHSDYFVVNFTNQSMHLLFKKLLKHNSGTSNEDEILTNLLSQILRKSIDSHFAASLIQDNLKELVNGNTFLQELCCQIINLHPKHAPTITKQLKKKAIDLTAQIPFILACFKLDSDSKYLLTYLGRIKEPLLQWSINANSEANELCEIIIFHILQKNIFDILELQNICNHWYTQVIKLKSNPPAHILNLSPIYDFLSVEERKLHEKNCLSTNLQFLSINIHLVSKLYGKEIFFSFSKVSSNILKLASELEKSCIKSELEDLSKIWGNFIKKILKHGLTDFQHGPQLLTCLASLIKIVYVEPRHDLMLPLSTILQMLMSHSEFISTLLSQENDILAVKEKVVTLIQTIVEMDSSSCEENHVPLFLGGYNASMSNCDQAILKLLFWYEQNGFMPTFLPTIWGKSAISHFAIEKGPGMALEYRHPNHKEIFGLLDNDKVIETAMKFDMHLNLEPELTSTCDSDLYDQRFLLMIFLLVTDEKPTMNVMDMMSKGIVAIGISALSSHCDEVWAAGAAILKNVVILLEQSGYQYLKLQWMWLVAVLGYGLETKRTRVPSVIVHFLIKATQLLTNPDDVMYKVVLNYLYLKPAFSLHKVPELYVLYFSDDIEHHKEHRSFFLNLLSSGIRDGLDVQLCYKEAIPKYTLGLLTSPTATYQIKSLALRVLKSFVSIPEGALLLVQDYGLLTQLPLALQPTTLCSKENLPKLLNSIIGILAALWDTWNNKMKFSSQEKSFNSHETRKRPRSLSNADNEIDIPSKKLKNSLDSLPSVSEGLNLKKYKNSENWLVLEYAVCLKNMSSHISLYGSLESKLCYKNLCKESSVIDR